MYVSIVLQLATVISYSIQKISMYIGIVLQLATVISYSIQKISTYVGIVLQLLAILSRRSSVTGNRSAQGKSQQVLNTQAMKLFL